MGVKNGDPNAKRRKMREPRVVLPSSAARDSPAASVRQHDSLEWTTLDITAAGNRRHARRRYARVNWVLRPRGAT